MTVHCFNDECVYYKNGACTASEIFISDEGCDSIIPYTDTKEYQSEYWARVITEDKKTNGRALKHGKRIIVNGREFFTESDTRVDDHYIFVTDGRTGLGCGNLSFLKKNWEKYDEMASKFGNVADLPLCEYDTVKRVMKIKEEEEK